MRPTKRLGEREAVERRAQVAEEHEKVHRERSETAAIIDSLSNEELAEYHQRVLQKANPFQQHQWMGADPRQRYTLQVAIARLWRVDQTASASTSEPVSEKPSPLDQVGNDKASRRNPRRAGGRPVGKTGKRKTGPPRRRPVEEGSTHGTEEAQKTAGA